MKMKKNLVTLNNYLLLFYTAAIAGFVWEVLLYWVQEQAFYKRGFFYGPWLPVYGCGAVMIYFFLHKKKSHPVRCFFYSGLIGAGVEFLTGWFLFTFFHLRYWDYTGQFLNVGGYICLYSVLGFSLAGMGLVCFAAPRILRMWTHLPLRLRLNLIGALLLLSSVDAAFSLFFPNTGEGITF